MKVQRHRKEKKENECQPSICKHCFKVLKEHIGYLVTGSFCGLHLRHMTVLDFFCFVPVFHVSTRCSIVKTNKQIHLDIVGGPLGCQQNLGRYYQVVAIKSCADFKNGAILPKSHILVKS